MPISTKTKCLLRSKAHALKPVILMGHQGLTDGVHQNIELALTAHELIKIKLSTSDKPSRQAIIEDIATQHGAEIIQEVGNRATFYRKNPEKN